jgi:uncharacterized membrane protein YesL
MFGLDAGELLVVALPIVGAVVGIGVLCYVWMKNSRASQTRMEAQNQEIALLLREQNSLLRKIAERQ